MTICLGVQLETAMLSQDVSDIVNMYGELIDVFLRTEATVERDRYGSIKKDKPVTAIKIAAFPINVNPTTDEMEKAGLREKTDLILHTSAKDWATAGVDWKDLDHERTTFNYDGQLYKMKEKGRAMKISNVYMYWTFSLSIK